MTEIDRHPLGSLTANSAWVDALLDLFWTVDEEMNSDPRKVNPQTIKDAHAKAEAARQRL